MSAICQPCSFPADVSKGAEHSSKGAGRHASSSSHTATGRIVTPSVQISRDEVVVTPTCPEHYLESSFGLAWSCPLEVYDLPGARVLPAHASASSKAIYETYSRLPDAIIVCVAEASLSDLRSAQVLADAVEAMPDRTIVCLTKADLVFSQEVQTKIIDRLEGSAMDVQDFADQPCFVLSCQDSTAANEPNVASAAAAADSKGFDPSKDLLQAGC